MRREGDRYDMHPMLARFAREQLAGDSADAGRDRRRSIAYFGRVILQANDAQINESSYLYKNAASAVQQRRRCKR
ncbi:MAG: hypothetical protein ACK4SA_06230 [Caldilinea sp.]